MQEPPLDRRYRLSDSTLCTDLDGEMVLLHYGIESYFSLNRTGTKLWYLLERGATVSELVEHIAASYAVSRDQALGDLASFLESLEQNALIELVEE